MAARIISCALALALLGSPLTAQEAEKEILQPEPPAPANVSIEQLEEAAPAAPIDQLSSAGQAHAPPQLAPQQPDATPPPSLSRRADGRPLPSAPIGGKDRCDSEAQVRKPSPECRRVIERRADEFARTRPVASPEQQLLSIQISSRDGDLGIGRTPEQGYRALGSDPDMRTSQELASLVLQPAPQPQPQQAPEPTELEASLAEILSNLSVITNAPPPSGN